MHIYSPPTSLRRCSMVSVRGGCFSMSPKRRQHYVISPWFGRHFLVLVYMADVPWRRSQDRARLLARIKPYSHVLLTCIAIYPSQSALSWELYTRFDLVLHIVGFRRLRLLQRSSASASVRAAAIHGSHLCCGQNSFLALGYSHPQRKYCCADGSGSRVWRLLQFIPHKAPFHRHALRNGCVCMCVMAISAGQRALEAQLAIDKARRPVTVTLPFRIVQRLISPPIDISPISHRLTVSPRRISTYVIEKGRLLVQRTRTRGGTGQSSR
ncbi:hypothetical protein FKP32DRAFT_237020 [Trametes sanguinea]|nr:hypothetical protein FKP32DRAFT_237020 [Trametes sanguinea]